MWYNRVNGKLTHMVEQILFILFFPLTIVLYKTLGYLTDRGQRMSATIQKSIPAQINYWSHVVDRDSHGYASQEALSTVRSLWFALTPMKPTCPRLTSDRRCYLAPASVGVFLFHGARFVPILPLSSRVGHATFRNRLIDCWLHMSNLVSAVLTGSGPFPSGPYHMTIVHA